MTPAPFVPVLGVPYSNQPELLLRLVESIDVPVGCLHIIDQQIEPLELGRRLELERAAAKHCKHLLFASHPNTGCAGAWNEIVTTVPAPWWMLVNDDIAFRPGDLEAMCAVVESSQVKDGEPGQYGLAAVYGNHGCSWWAVTRMAIRRVGLFDENLWPAYLEDCDWKRRRALLELQVHTLLNVNAVHGVPSQRGSCTANANTDMRRFIQWCHGEGFRYYREKWGGINEHETFATPFNDPHWPLWAWHFRPKWRAHLTYDGPPCPFMPKL